MPTTFLNCIFCPHCSKSFVSQRGRTTHIRTVHPNHHAAQHEADQSDRPSSDDEEADWPGTVMVAL